MLFRKEVVVLSLSCNVITFAAKVRISKYQDNTEDSFVRIWRVSGAILRHLIVCFADQIDSSLYIVIIVYEPNKMNLQFPVNHLLSGEIVNDTTPLFLSHDGVFSVNGNGDQLQSLFNMAWGLSVNKYHNERPVNKTWMHKKGETNRELSFGVIDTRVREGTAT